MIRLWRGGRLISLRADAHFLPTQVIKRSTPLHPGLSFLCLIITLIPHTPVYGLYGIVFLYDMSDVYS
jgi:hypothetical protein